MKVKLLVNLTDVGKVGEEVEVDDAVGQQYCALNYARQLDGESQSEQSDSEYSE